MRSSIEDLVRDVVAAHLEVPVNTIKATQSFLNDLGIPPLGVILIALDIEDLEGISLPFEHLMQTRTISDLCDLVRGAEPATAFH